MQFSSSESYLFLNYNPLQNFYSLHLLANKDDAIEGWGALSRISPVWRLDYEERNKSKPFIFDKGNTFVLFLGPCSPQKLRDSIGQRTLSNIEILATLEIFNLVIAAKQKKSLEEIIKWAGNEKISSELWDLKNGKVLTQSINSVKPEYSTSGDWKKALRKADRSVKKGSTLSLAFSEFIPLALSAVTRSEIYAPKFSLGLNNLTKYIEYIINEYQNSSDPFIDQKSTAQIAIINAGLSRLSSQGFSGISPILNTESHFWVHSLLGVGIPILGLSSFVGFISKNVGGHLIPNRIQSLRDRKYDKPEFRKLPIQDPYWVENIIDDLDPIEDDSPMCPDIPFFSGRDGYRSHLTNISAPIGTIFASATDQWNLLTITHEMSHKIIKQILASLLPTDETEDSLTIAKPQYDELLASYFNDNKQPENWLDMLRISIGSALIDMDSVTKKIERNGVADSRDEEVNIGLVVSKWHGEAEEILVHVFDFLYFYRFQDDVYLKEIWLSWSTIPNISERINGYVVRSICAVLSHNFNRGDSAISFSIERVRAVLSAVFDAHPETPYLKEALNFLDEPDDKSCLTDQILARLPLIRFVRKFLYSEALINKLWAERSISSVGKNSKKGGYRKTSRFIDGELLSNPLNFCLQYANKSKISTAESAWLFYVLAFELMDD